MSVALANMLVDVLRGTETDEYDDLVDDLDEVVATDVPVSLTREKETNYQRDSRFDSDRERNVFRYVGRANVRHDIKQGDRLREKKTGFTYLVDVVFDFDSGVLNTNFRFAARRID